MMTLFGLARRAANQESISILLTFTLAEPGHRFRAALQGIEPPRIQIVALGQPLRHDNPWRNGSRGPALLEECDPNASDLVAAYSRSAPARRPGSSMSARRVVSPRQQWRPTASGRAKCRLRRLVRFLQLPSSSRTDASKRQGDGGMKAHRWQRCRPGRTGAAARSCLRGGSPAAPSRRGRRGRVRSGASAQSRVSSGDN